MQSNSKASPRLSASMWPSMGSDLAVPEGTVYGFIGPNGSGKTTTLRMILRIFFPDRGVVRVLGLDHGDGGR